MAASETFFTVGLGKRFTLDGWHATDKGTALVLTKTSATAATDTTGRVWDFSNSQGLLCHAK